MAEVTVRNAGRSEYGMGSGWREVEQWFEVGIDGLPPVTFLVRGTIRRAATPNRWSIFTEVRLGGTARLIARTRSLAQARRLLLGAQPTLRLSFHDEEGRETVAA